MCEWKIRWGWMMLNDGQWGQAWRWGSGVGQRRASQDLLVQPLSTVRLESSILILQKRQPWARPLSVDTCCSRTTWWGEGQGRFFSPDGCCDLRSLPGGPLTTSCPPTLVWDTLFWNCHHQNQTCLVIWFSLILTNTWLTSLHASEKKKGRKADKCTSAAPVW